MKKILLITLSLVILVSLIAATPLHLIRLTVENKSGYNAAIWLNGIEFGQTYYLTLDEGDRDYPELKLFTILPDDYDVEIQYLNGEVKVWETLKEIDMTLNTKLVLTEPKIVDHLNDCDPEDEEKDCKVKFLLGERSKWMFLPLGYWRYQYHY